MGGLTALPIDPLSSNTLKLRCSAVASLVSILIPCFNAERWVAQAIESALAQTWPEKEVVVVDDGSTDGSLDIIKRFGDRIRWETGPNRGGNVARNRLLELARGEWLQYLDADDYLLSDKVANQMACLAKHSESDVIYSPVFWVRIDRKGEWSKEITPIPEPRDPWVLLARWYLPQTGGALWSRFALQRVGGWRLEQLCCQEHELYLRLLMVGARFTYFDECRSAWRDWSAGSTVSTRNRAEVRRQRLKIVQQAENFLRKRNGLTPERLDAINQTRFELARVTWPNDPDTAKQILRTIRLSVHRFAPKGPAAPAIYRALYRIFGFAVAERLAAWKRMWVGNPPLP